MIKLTHVDGKDVGKVVLYALSTCAWCKRVKKLLAELNIGYDYIDADFFNGKESDEIVAEVKRWNPKETYPTLVINDKEAIIGIDKEKIKGLLK